MIAVVKASLDYVLPVFALAFLIGAIRVTVIVPLTGPLLAVALEVPLVLAFSWFVAGRVLSRWPLAGRRSALAALSFAFLMLLELLTALALGQTSTQFFAAMTTAPGTLGLAGQIGFALIPLFRQPRG
jgi:hypothetical protein